MHCTSLACTALVLLTPVLFAHEIANEPTADSATTDWSSFDPAAAIAKASEPPEERPFKRLWTTKERVRLLHGLAISANGKRVLAVASDGRPQVYDGDSGQPLAKVAENLGLITKAALSPDGSRGAVGLASTEVVTFDATSGKILHRHPPDDARKSQPKPKMTILQFTADGQHVSWFTTYGHLQRADIASGERIHHLFQVSISDTRVTGLSPDGLVVAFPYEPYKRDSRSKPMLKFLVLPPPGSDEEPKELDRDYGDEAPVAMALSPNLIAFQTLQGSFLVQHSLHRRLPLGARQRAYGVNHLTASRTVDAQLQISSDEKWSLELGRGQAQLRRLDMPFLPSLHNLEVESTAQAALAADVRRIAVVDQDAHLSVQALDDEPQLAVWEFIATLRKLIDEKQFELLDKLSDALQDDPEPFWFSPLRPKHSVLMEKWMPADESLVDEWLSKRPESKAARLLLVRRLISAGWRARGTGFANTVTREGAQVFQQKITEAHVEMEKLMALDRPPPEAWMYLFEVAKGESWSEEKCLEEADRLMDISPQYLTPHLAMTEKLLMRWGGEAHSCAMYAAWAGDKIGGAEGDALYAQLIARVAGYEPKELLKGPLQIDWDRAYRGCKALQDMPQRRPLGVLTELVMADAAGDSERLPPLAQIIDRERTPYYALPRLPRFRFEKLYRDNVDRVPVKLESL